MSLVDARTELEARLEQHDIFANRVRLNSSRIVTITKRVNNTDLIVVRVQGLKKKIENALPGAAFVSEDVKPWRGGRSITLRFQLPQEGLSKQWWEVGDEHLSKLASLLEESKASQVTTDELDTIFAEAGNPISVRAMAKALYREGIPKIDIVHILAKRTGKKVLYQQVYQACMHVIPIK